MPLDAVVVPVVVDGEAGLDRRGAGVDEVLRIVGLGDGVVWKREWRIVSEPLKSDWFAVLDCRKKTLEYERYLQLRIMII